ncbi:MAG: hypothetical protein B6229_03585 [Spirochaetaceae bacterium 4572_7]|nr:MAG: hypothetical protein B6229_03585 [Spirochaetaceae bacterium 4572_7]
MEQCEYYEKCSFITSGNKVELREQYCDSNPLHCARYMILEALGSGKVPDDLFPDEKIKAYAILAES